jgi:hypothetical protein
MIFLQGETVHSGPVIYLRGPSHLLFHLGLIKDSAVDPISPSFGQEDVSQ